MSSSTVTRALLVCGLAMYGCRAEGDRHVAVEATDTTPAPAAGAPAPATSPSAAEGAPGAMEVELLGRNGQRVGTARLSEEGQGVRIAIQASNLPTSGARGFHFHETGSCQPPSFESAGAHFAPDPRQHGLENPQGPHAGDMPNLPVREAGAVDTVLSNPRVTLRTGQPNSLLRDGGTALVIHAQQDDQRTDPSGNSGDRIACGVVSQAGAGTP